MAIQETSSSLRDFESPDLIVRNHIVDIIIILNLALTSFLIMQVYQLKKATQDHVDKKKLALESQLVEASTLLKNGKTDEATEIVDRILKS